MVSVEKIKVKRNTYYKLSHPIRKGNKITHKSRYIGKKLPSKERLEQLKKEFLREMLEGKYKYLSSKDINSIENKRLSYNAEIRKLSHIEKEKQMKEFIIRFTYDSSKLSGVPVTLRQTSLILKEGIMPKDIKSLRTARELENHENGILAITKYKGRLDINFIKKLHLTLFAGVDDTIAGKTRYELKRDVKLAATPYVPPKWHELKKELDNFFKWHRSENRRLHPVESAALVHLKLISLQPFVDGNSRLSRLLMNWVLWKKNYPLIDIPIGDLENYYNALDKYQIEKDEKPFVNYIKKKYLDM
ncbi:Fic family protein [Candidatus Woesearchaeota archaeon]|nr:Fic family protein [Candidatus Woesearchaeota archaeon]